MGRLTGLINLVLAGLCVYFGLQIVDVWEENGPASRAAQAAPATPPTVNADGRPPSRPLPPETAYAVIEDRNLFSPDRTGPEADEEETEAPAKVQSAPTSVGLFGVMILKDVKKALVDDIDGSDSRPSQWVYEGDTVRGWTVETIEKDRITLTSANGTHDLSLYDRRKRRAAGKSGKDGPTVVGALENEKRTKSQADGVEKPNSQVTDAVEQLNDKQQSDSPNASSTDMKQPKRENIERQTDNAEDTEASAEYEIVKTPFGEIRRKREQTQ